MADEVIAKPAIDLRDFWYIACESKSLGRDRPVGTIIMNEWVALFRDANGNARAVQDACLHRNARLSKGKVKNGNLECPYHGWRYGEQGQVLAVPSEGSSYQPRAKWCVKTFAVCEQEGYIYVRLNPQASLGEGYDKPFLIPNYHTPGYRHIRLKHSFHNSVPNCAENFIDIPHTVFVHPNIFRYQREPQKLIAECETSKGHVHIRYKNESSNLGVFSTFLNRKGTEIFHEDHYYLPNITHVEYKFGPRRHFHITSQSIPVGDTITDVYTDLTFDYGIWNLFAIPFVWYTGKKIISQDVKIMGEQNEVVAHYGERFISTRADLQHLWIEKIYAELRAGKDPRILPQKNETVEFWI